MKYAAAAALVATVYGADAATKVCDTDPIKSIEAFSDAGTTCAAKVDPADPKAATAVTAANTALKPFINTCAAVTDGVKVGGSPAAAATHAKVTCTDTVLTITYYKAAECKDADKVTDGTPTWKSVTAATCVEKAWDGTTALEGGALSTGSKAMKVTLKPTVAAKKDDAATTDAKTLGAAVAATTLAVAATLY